MEADSLLRMKLCSVTGSNSMNDQLLVIDMSRTDLGKGGENS